MWNLCSKLPHSREFNGYVNQLIRSSSSVGANYRAATRAKSTADFVNKLKIVEEEADESQYFLELILEVQKDPALVGEIERLRKDADEFVAIVVSSIKSLKFSWLLFHNRMS